MSGGFEATIWALLVIASVTDLLWGKIFNGITFPFLAAGLICRYFLTGPRSLGEGLLGAGVAFLLFFPLWQIRTLAAGDVKLLMAVGAWSDSATVIRLGVFAILVGALVGLFTLLRRQGLRETLTNVFAHLKRKENKVSHRMPFAPAFLCGFALIRIAEMQQWRWI